MHQFGIAKFGLKIGVWYLKQQMEVIVDLLESQEL
jgi:hypothetical protein